MVGLVVIFVPALNEEEAIEAVVTGALAVTPTVFVIDDGSRDRTAERATRAGATVIRHEINRGVGAAVAAGLAAAQECGATVAVQVDGDGQHDIASVNALLDVIAGGSQLVIGNRFGEGFPMSLVRRTGTRVFATAVSRLVGVRIEDPTSGFRAFDSMAIDRLLPIFPHRYLSDTVELILLAHEQELRISTVPVRMFERSTGRASEGPIRSVVLAMRVVGIIIRHVGTGRKRR